MRTRDLLLESYGRIDQTLRRVLDGLDADQLAAQVTPGANPIGWLAWHLLRVQDDHVAEVAGSEQVWTADGWARRFDLPVDDSATGYGFSSEQVAQVRVRSVDLLSGTPTRCTAARSSTSGPSVTTTSTAWSTTRGTRRSLSACGWSACFPTTCSTSGKPPTCAVACGD